MSKYQAGEEVEVSFMGRISAVDFDNGKVSYKVTTEQKGAYTYAHNVKEENIHSLLTPEMIARDNVKI